MADFGDSAWVSDGDYVVGTPPYVPYVGAVATTSNNTGQPSLIIWDGATHAEANSYGFKSFVIEEAEPEPPIDPSTIKYGPLSWDEWRPAQMKIA